MAAETLLARLFPFRQVRTRASIDHKRAAILTTRFLKYWSSVMPHRAANERIVIDPAVLLGKPIVRGTRVPVWLIVGLIEAGQSPKQIVDDYPDLTVEDVEAAAAYAAAS